MVDIFISYAKEDGRYVRPLAHYLEGKGWNVFWDHDIPPGSTWVEFIGQKLDQSRLVLVIWSAQSIESKWVKREASIALDKDILLPVSLENVVPPSIFASIQSASLIGWDGKTKTENVADLVESIERLIGPPPAALESTTAASHEPKRSPSSRIKKPSEENAPFRPTATAVMQSNPAQGGRSRWWLAAVAALLLFGAVTILIQRFEREPATIESAAPDTGAARANLLVEEGDRASASGSLFEPDAGSALDFYRRALALVPDHAAATRGITLIAQHILQAGEDAVRSGDGERADQYLETLRSLPGQGPAVAQLEHSIQEYADNERQQKGRLAALNAQFEYALSRNDLPRANDALAQMERLELDITKLAELRERFEHAEKSSAAVADQGSQIEFLLQQAAADLAASRLTAPAGGNASERYRRVLELDPGNPAAEQGLAEIGKRLVALAEKSIARQRFDRAEGLIAKARSLSVAPATIEELTRQLESARAHASERAAATAREQAERDRIEEQRRRDEAASDLAAEREAVDHSASQMVTAPAEAAQISNVVVEFDGFTNQLKMYGLNEGEIRTEVEAMLAELGYTVAPFDIARQSAQAQLVVVKLRANLNSATGIYSYASSLLLYKPLPPFPGQLDQLQQQPIWQTGNSGIAVQTEIRKVREEYRSMLRLFAREVGRAADNS